jgi:hypothetical protein
LDRARHDPTCLAEPFDQVLGANASQEDLGFPWQPRPIWRGHLRLALVSCPVALYNARHDRAALRFNLINPQTGNRIRMITQDSETGQALQRRYLAKGYEFRKTTGGINGQDETTLIRRLGWPTSWPGSPRTRPTCWR